MKTNKLLFFIVSILFFSTFINCSNQTINDEVLIEADIPESSYVVGTNNDPTANTTFNKFAPQILRYLKVEYTSSADKELVRNTISFNINNIANSNYYFTVDSNTDVFYFTENYQANVDAPFNVTPNMCIICPHVIDNIYITVINIDYLQTLNNAEKNIIRNDFPDLMYVDLNNYYTEKWYYGSCCNAGSTCGKIANFYSGIISETVIQDNENGI